MTSPAAMVFRFTLLGHKWNWPVEGADSIIAFREILVRAGIEYEAVQRAAA